MHTEKSSLQKDDFVGVSQQNFICQVCLNRICPLNRFDGLNSVLVVFFPHKKSITKFLWSRRGDISANSCQCKSVPEVNVTKINMTKIGRGSVVASSS